MFALCTPHLLSFFLFCFFAVRELDAGISPAISIHHLGNVGATKSERAGISKLKSDMKLVRFKKNKI